MCRSWVFHCVVDGAPKRKLIEGCETGTQRSGVLAVLCSIKSSQIVNNGVDLSADFTWGVRNAVHVVVQQSGIQPTDLFGIKSDSKVDRCRCCFCGIASNCYNGCGRNTGSGRAVNVGQSGVYDVVVKGEGEVAGGGIEFGPCDTNCGSRNSVLGSGQACNLLV
eukprot:Phypoly_transcript_07538.p1 GENE.Phypoly_transcript_07538~~Phypoly_transcript_07538.p1  ORF type:complete len:164 (-),score=0.82 Phypoly_transcript_07538:755-1246(-)